MTVHATAVTTPSRARRVSAVLALCVAALLYTAVTGGIALGPACIAIALGSLMRSDCTRLSTPAQSLLLALCAAIGAMLVPLLPVVDGLGERELRRAYPALAAGALLFATLRTHLRDADWGTPGTLALGLVVLLACGSVKSGPIYPTLVFLYLALACLALRTDGDTVPIAATPRRHATAAVLVFALAIGASLYAARILPLLYLRADALMLRLIQRRAAGFHDGTIALGALEGLLQSDAIVLRVEGEVGPLLRGNVYADYDHGAWRGRRRTVGPPGLAGPPGASALPHIEEIRLTDAIPERAPRTARLRYAGRRLDRFFLPWGASHLALDPPDVEVDSYGIVRLPSGSRPSDARLMLGEPERLEIAPPRHPDLALPEAIAERLREHAARAVGSVESSGERLARIVTLLEREYTYSLHFTPDRSAADPILSFLETHRQGHCEYFATAVVLLARAAGLPARMVTGFRVAEHNPYGDYYIVRERHAHAWAEVYLADTADPGWVTVDPRPLRSLEPDLAATTPWLRGAADAAFMWTRDNGRALMLILLGATFVGIQIHRLLRGRRDVRRASAPGRAPTPPHLRELFAKLASVGHARPPSESLEDFGARLESATSPVHAQAPASGVEPDLREAARLVARYAAMRYGARGDAMALERDVRRWIDTLGRPQPGT